MKPFNRKLNAIRVLALGLACAAMFSFSHGSDGRDSYEIYVDKKLVLKQFVDETKNVGTFALDQKDPNAQVDVFYNHCGRIGLSRTITIRDAKNNVLKQWNFPDVSGDNKFMTCKAKDILGLQKKGSGKLSLHYSAQQLPKGQMLASIVVGDEKKSAAR